MKNKTLSEKERFDAFAREHVYSRKDVKEAVSKLKAILYHWKTIPDYEDLIDKIDNKIFGDFK